MTSQTCRFCGRQSLQTFVDLGMSPLANAYLTREQLQNMERFYPLHCFVCDHCFLVQLEEFEGPQEIYHDYAYFSSYSDTWLKHAQGYVEAMLTRENLTPQSQVVEIGSNDGYLLQYFMANHIPVLGIEPAANVARVAQDKGIPTLSKFFNSELAGKLVRDGLRADLIIGNNVLAHVPDLNDFVDGLKILLKPQGLITLEFPHLMQLIAGNQFDTIYHEHFSYFSFTTVDQVFAAHQLKLVEVEELPTHGGSLRIYAAHAENAARGAKDRVAQLKQREAAHGLTRLETYQAFDERARQTKRQILKFLIHAKEEGKSLVGYGAAAKGNTLLNYCGIRRDFLDYVVDRSPYKQGLFLPGTHLLINPIDMVRRTRPDYLFILPWNIKEEIMEHMAYIREWGGKFVVPIPEVEVVN
jgi:2-polyprenyl-3-methyl-5-hydroxy-6-metoxy-1,4-benzoquinol methylase